MAGQRYTNARAMTNITDAKTKQNKTKRKYIVQPTTWPFVTCTKSQLTG